MNETIFQRIYNSAHKLSLHMQFDIRCSTVETLLVSVECTRITAELFTVLVILAQRDPDQNKLALKDDSLCIQIIKDFTIKGWI